MTRTRFYVIHCTVEERDHGTEHHERFDSKQQAIERAKQISLDEFIAVEKHNEVFTRNDWLPNWDMGESCSETIDW